MATEVFMRYTCDHCGKQTDLATQLPDEWWSDWMFAFCSAECHAAGKLQAWRLQAAVRDWERQQDEWYKATIEPLTGAYGAEHPYPKFEDFKED